MTALLALDNVSKRFRGLVAVDRVSFSVQAGDIYAVIGPNGAGKTTLFNMIAGVFAPVIYDSFGIGVAREPVPSTLRPTVTAAAGQTARLVVVGWYGN